MEAVEEAFKEDPNLVVPDESEGSKEKKDAAADKETSGAPQWRLQAAGASPMKHRSSFAREQNNLKLEQMEEEDDEGWSSETVSDEDVLNEYGHTKCKQSWIDYRESFKPLLADKISDPKDSYEFVKLGFKGRGEFYDIVQVRDKFTGEYRAMKTFRKSELT